MATGKTEKGPACMNHTDYFTELDACADAIIQRIGNRIVLGTPLGLGKPNYLINALYRRACNDPQLKLTIITALSLERPTGNTDLERRFLDPFVVRHFGNYPDLDYMHDLRNGTLPDNIKINEFYFKSGGFLHNPLAQQGYISSNYTFVTRDMLDRGVNVIVQMVAARDQPEGRRYSLGSNPDLTLDMVPRMRERSSADNPVMVVAQINRNMPFMYRDAMVEPQFFDAVLDNPEMDYKLFGVPNMPVSTVDHHIGMYASALLSDGGTLQLGIGSLGDAVAYATEMRHGNNAQYRQFLGELCIDESVELLIERWGGREPFSRGLYVASEMISNGLWRLYEAGVIKRRVYDHLILQKLVSTGVIIESRPTLQTLDNLHVHGAINAILSEADFNFLVEYGFLNNKLIFENDQIATPDGKMLYPDLTSSTARDMLSRYCLGPGLRNGILMHGAFFLGPEDFYSALRNMEEGEAESICMTAVSKVNQLYNDEELGRLQRLDARFINACMKMTLSGAAVSDGLADGQVISGVGGQYNFVAMAHALENARSILLMRSTRLSPHGLESNVVFNYGNITIPRHLRDIVVTEYGIADLRGKTDSEIISTLLNVTDSRYQGALLRRAKRAGKIHADYVIPDRYRHNTPEKLERNLLSYRGNGLFPEYPFGTDFSVEEIRLLHVLRELQRSATQWRRWPGLVWKLLVIRPDYSVLQPYLARMQLEQPRSVKESFYRRLLGVLLHPES